MSIPRFLLPAVCAIPALILLALFQSPLKIVDNQMVALNYRLRGDVPVDTNIVIVYVDNDAVPFLGWPVRRNFYSLMVKALTDLNVSTIGIAVQFEVPGSEYREYDDLLQSVIRSSGRVVLPMYFESVEQQGMSYEGREAHFPLPSLRAAAARIGHANTVNQIDVPAIIDSGGTAIPAFGLAIGSEFLHARVLAGKEGVHVAANDRDVSLPHSGDGLLHLNLPRTFSAFTAYPFLEVLKAYDALRADQAPSIPIGSLRNKIVLIGVIGEGRSEFYDTPSQGRFPALGLHAVVIDNLLRGSFLHIVPRVLVYCLAVLLALISAASVLWLSPGPSRVSVSLCVLVPLVGSFLMFTLACTMIPFTPLAAAVLLSGFTAQVYKHRLVRKEISHLTEEKNSIAAELSDKEAKLAVLERELRDATAKRSEDRTHELLEEIRRYKGEIRELSSRADDMVVYDAQESPAEDTLEEIVYTRNGRMGQVIEFIVKIAGSDAAVLILGDSGTGKELVARAIHKRSPRAQKPFVAVNCGALSENLLESELFGHEKGAFTGAVKDKMGRFELADGGTIFLDEIGEVSEGFQVKLLRVLQEGELERVGGTKTITVNVRVLAATNKDLKEQVRTKRFREDLYYRLNVLSVALPPLKERQGDIPLLVNHFLRREEGDLKVSKNVMESLVAYGWPGNIRELESAITRAALLARADKRSMITMKDLNEDIASAIQGSVNLEDQILSSLREKAFSRSSVSETADELGGLSRGTVAEYLRGQCLQAFVENNFDIERTVFSLSLSNDPEMNERLQKKLQEYLRNISEAIDLSTPWEQVLPALRPKMKNLPQRYHQFLQRAGEGYYRGQWKHTS